MTSSLTVLGVPGQRRLTLYAEAVRAAGLPAPRVLSWRTVLREGVVFAPQETVRLDSPGEDREVDRLLRGPGDPTRVAGGALWYSRFTTAVRSVATAARRAGAQLLDDPEELAVLFDKRLCHGVLCRAGVSVPPSPTSGSATEPIRGWADLRDLLNGSGLRRAFVKPAHGSSASGVLALELAGPGRTRVTTAVERTADGGLFNSLRVRQYTAEREIAAIVDGLAPDGLHVERWMPKATQHGRATDLRVVVVAGRATHAVVRGSHSPLTNLRLGGIRGDLELARSAVESAGVRWAEVLELAERAAACFPDTLCVGVDVLPGIGWRRFSVGEVNAFGDLLPRLTGLPGSGAEGLDTYGAQLAALPWSGLRGGSRQRPAPGPPGPSDPDTGRSALR